LKEQEMLDLYCFGNPDNRRKLISKDDV